MDNITEELNQLLYQWNELNALLEKTHQDWAGSDRNHFDRNIIGPAQDMMGQYLKALEKLSLAINQANSVLNE